MEQKARVKDEHTTHGESSFGKKLWCVLLILLLGVIGWQIWKINPYNNAVREAKEARFGWTCDDAISLIRQDWRNALKKETWGKHHRKLRMWDVLDLGRYREMLHQLRPTVLIVNGCKDENVDALKGLTSLQSLDLSGCGTLKIMDGLKDLIALQTLDLSGCYGQQNVDALKRLTSLQLLDLSGCYVLLNVDALKDLTALQTLDLSGCAALQNVDGIKGITALRTLDLHGCDKIPDAALRELRAALPNTDITFPDGTKNPPQ